ncbi:calcium channel flower-like [Apostichopus japonicus]|uniref:calcium channel flower-like n=1 Tax=Stichopus japonicus TaxID=307972 RepID=UPI003AB83689
MSTFGYKQENLSGLPEDPNNAPSQQPQQMGFFTKTAIHIIGAVAGAFTMFLGLFSCFSVQGLCILSGIYLMFLGFGLIVMEAPVCCKFWEVTDKLGQWSQALSPLIKAALYLLLPVAAFFMCIGVTQIFAILLVMGVGALYGIVFIGKKGDGVKVARQQHMLGSQGVTMAEMESQEKPPAYAPNQSAP